MKRPTDGKLAPLFGGRDAGRKSGPVDRFIDDSCTAPKARRRFVIRFKIADKRVSQRRPVSHPLVFWKTKVGANLSLSVSGVTQKKVPQEKD